MKTQEEIEQLAKKQKGCSKEYCDSIDEQYGYLNGYIEGYTQCQQDMADEISRFLRENLKVVIKQDLKFSNRTKANFVVIVMLGDEQISTTDFTVYS